MSRFSFDQAFATVATSAVIAGIVGGFWVLGTPARQREIAADRQRLQDLGAIAQNLHQQYLNQPDTYQLPDTLPTAESRNDPLTNQPYEYERQGDRNFQLCATFDTDSRTYPLANRPNDPALERWHHPQGRHCFTFEVSEYPGVVYY
ncbi:MAG: hypothetical protein HC929_11875 [Leptolyngbyaceae cyanobacterium SM2_5_2]|nr:hypothetical protein [Leptolyngbyaceae cyanobacterium SM2_5_2]